MYTSEKESIPKSSPAPPTTGNPSLIVESSQSQSPNVSITTKPPYPPAVSIRSSLLPASASHPKPIPQSVAFRHLSPKIPGLNHIRSIRMGPPYLTGARNIVPYMPHTVKFMPKPSAPMIYRNRFFNCKSFFTGNKQFLDDRFLMMMIIR